MSSDTSKSPFAAAICKQVLWVFEVRALIFAFFSSNNLHPSIQPFCTQKCRGVNKSCAVADTLALVVFDEYEGEKET